MNAVFHTWMKKWQNTENEREKKYEGIGLWKLLEKNKRKQAPHFWNASRKWKRRSENKLFFSPQWFYWNHCWLLLQMETGSIVNIWQLNKRGLLSTWQHGFLWIAQNSCKDMGTQFSVGESLAGKKDKGIQKSNEKIMHFILKISSVFSAVIL